MKKEPGDVSRRGLLKSTALAAIVAGSGSLMGQAPAVVTARRFRGWVTRGGGTNRTTLQELTLRPVSGRQIVVRAEATNLCYSNVGAVLGLQANLAPPAAAGARGAVPAPAAGGAPAAPRGGGQAGGRALIQGHGGVGIVEAIGSEVRRVQVGDRVCVSGTPQCGNCYQCLRGRADMCQFLSRQGPNDLFAIADMSDGTPVYANSLI